MKPRIFVSTFPFARNNTLPLEHLKKSGFEICLNSTGRKISGKELYEHASDCDGIIAGTEDLSELIAKNPKLRIISRVGVGLDSVPLSICKEKNITVSYTPDAVSFAVAELTLGFMIGLCRHLQKADVDLRSGGWNRFQGKGLNESVIGIVGFGRIGKLVASMLGPFSPIKILVSDLKKIDLSPYKHLNIEQVDNSRIFTDCDILTLHIPGSKSNQDFINKTIIEKMKSTAYLINTARGGLVNENDLFDALGSNKLQGAALDVFAEEPYKGNLKTLKNIVLTQHMGSCSDQARLGMELEAAEDIVRFFKGETLRNMVPQEEYELQAQN